MKRKAQKRSATGRCEKRNAQFLTSAGLLETYEQAGNPTLSVETKKKEHLGSLSRDGTVYGQRGQELVRWEHDCSHLSAGVSIPHGIYDFFKNTADVTSGTSKDTSEFACASVRRWWNFRGRYDWPEADSILMLVDAGGSNSYRSALCKEDLQRLVAVLGIEVRVAHYPSYCAKGNLIAQRVFPHIPRALQGVVVDHSETCKALVETTTTETGLVVRAHIMDKVYQTGRTVSSQYLEDKPMFHEEYLPHWNYTAVPRVYW